MPYILTTYRLDTGEQPRVHSKTKLNLPKDDALRALAAMREGLPSTFAVSLTDEYGRNIR